MKKRGEEDYRAWKTRQLLKTTNQEDEGRKK